MGNGAHGSGYDGPREAIRQLERRADQHDAVDQALWQTVGGITTSQARIEQKLDSEIERRREDKEDQDEVNVAVERRLSRLSGLAWAILASVLLLFAGAIVNLLVIVANGGAS